MKTYRIIYASAAARPFGPAELERLLLQARIYNFSENIGGLLLRAGPALLQVLEGPEPAVAILYARIAADPRHYEVRPLAAAGGSRLFLHASMGFADVEPAALGRLTAYLDPLHRRALLPAGYDEQAIMADLLLEFVALHCPHVLSRPGDRAGSRPQRAPCA